MARREAATSSASVVVNLPPPVVDPRTTVLEPLRPVPEPLTPLLEPLTPVLEPLTPVLEPLTRLVLASNNAGKLREFRRLLSPLGIELVAQAALGVDEADEPHTTFLENALAKARHASTRTGLPALADDSGVCVDALGGAPGVQSARFAGEPKSDARNNDKLVAALRGSPDRRAHYYCVLILLRRADDPEPIIAEGVWTGSIIESPRGSGGFGYDPYFEDAATGLTGAELPLERKNALSHRGKAMRQLLARLQGSDRP